MDECKLEFTEKYLDFFRQLIVGLSFTILMSDCKTCDPAD